MDGQILTNAAQLGETIRGLAKLVDVPAFQKCLMQGGHVFEAEIKDNIKRHHLIETRHLTNATTTAPEGTDAVTIGPRNVIYATIHEYGGTITPKQAQFLAVPLTGEAKNARSPRRMPGLTVRISKGGKSGVLLAGDVAQYALVKSVKIPARPYVRPAFDQKAEEAVKTVGNAVLRVLHVNN